MFFFSPLIFHRPYSQDLRDGLFIDFETCSFQPTAANWNIKVFGNVIRELCTQRPFAWKNVLRAMDMPSFDPIDGHGLEIIVQVFSICCPNESFPFYEGFCADVWTNRTAQFSVLYAALGSSVDVTSSKGQGTAPNSDDRYNVLWSNPDYVNTLLQL